MGHRPESSRSRQGCQGEPYSAIRGGCNRPEHTLRIQCYELPRNQAAVAALFRFRLNPCQPHPMTRLVNLMRLGLAAAAAGSLALSGCSQTKEAATGVGEAARTAASGVGEAAKTAATATGQAALAPVVTPVLDLLKQGETDLKAGDVAGAVTAMGGFEGLWQKAGPVIQPLAGEKWGTIDTAAKTVISTFGNGAKPDAAAAGSAISGLLGPLSALVGK